MIDRVSVPWLEPAALLTDLGSRAVMSSLLWHEEVYRQPLPLSLFFLPSQSSLFFLFNSVTRSYSFNQQNASHNPPPPGPRQRNSRTKHNVPLRSADRQQQYPFYTQQYLSLSLQRKRKNELTEIRRPPRNPARSRHSPLQRSGNYDLSTEQRCV
jgi:hypothetical protein